MSETYSYARPRPERERDPSYSEIMRMDYATAEYWGAKLGAEIASIDGQIREWMQNPRRDDVRTSDWHDKASRALTTKRERLGHVRTRLAALDRDRANSGQDTQAMRRHKAFVEAVRNEMGNEFVNEMWNAAAEANPDIFPVPHGEENND